MSEVKIEQYDTSSITKVSPSLNKEEKIFSDPKLHYDHNFVANKGFFDKFLEWLAEKIFGKAGYENVSRAREIILWAIIIIAVIVVIRLIRRSEMVSLIKQKPKNTSFNFSDISEDLNSINFNKKIEEALLKNDYRLAIRWQYLKTLFLLDKKNRIIFAPFKTNIDYNNEIKDKELRLKFGNLSRIYEYVWYGKFVLNIDKYQKHSSEFESFDKKLDV